MSSIPLDHFAALVPVDNSGRSSSASQSSADNSFNSHLFVAPASAGADAAKRLKSSDTIERRPVGKEEPIEHHPESQEQSAHATDASENEPNAGNQPETEPNSVTGDGSDDTSNQQNEADRSEEETTAPDNEPEAVVIEAASTAGAQLEDAKPTDTQLMVESTQGDADVEAANTESLDEQTDARTKVAAKELSAVDSHSPAATDQNKQRPADNRPDIAAKLSNQVEMDQPIEAEIASSSDSQVAAEQVESPAELSNPNASETAKVTLAQTGDAETTEDLDANMNAEQALAKENASSTDSNENDGTGPGSDQTGSQLENTDESTPEDRRKTSTRQQSKQTSDVMDSTPSLAQQTTTPDTTSSLAQQATATTESQAAIDSSEPTETATEHSRGTTNEPTANSPISQSPTIGAASTNRVAQSIMLRRDHSANETPRLTEPEQTRFIARVARAFQAADARDGNIRIRLSPPELGSMSLEIRVDNGTITARVETESTMARNALLENLSSLQDRLAELDIKIDSFDVDVTERHDNEQADLFDRERGSRKKSDESQETADDRLLDSQAETETVVQALIEDGPLDVVV